MSHSPSPALVILQSSSTPLTIHELAAQMGCSVADALEATHLSWWPVEQIPGPDGWLYRARVLPEPRLPKPIERREQWSNARGTIKPGSYA